MKFLGGYDGKDKEDATEQNQHSTCIHLRFKGPRGVEVNIIK